MPAGVAGKVFPPSIVSRFLVLVTLRIIFLGDRLVTLLDTLRVLRIVFRKVDRRVLLGERLLARERRRFGAMAYQAAAVPCVVDEILTPNRATGVM